MTSGTKHPNSTSAIARIPLRDADPRAKVLAAAALVVGVVLLSPLSPVEFALLSLLVLLAGLIAASDVAGVLKRSLIVLPVAGAMAAFTPLRLVGEWSLAGVAEAFAAGWPAVVSLVATAWLCTFISLTLTSMTPAPELFAAMGALRVPSALVMLLSFISRYVDVLRGQVTSMHRALSSRAPGLSKRKQVLLYGNLAGALLVRAHDRGERVNAAMLSRGFDGTLPTNRELRFTAGDAAIVSMSVLAVLALALYR